MSDGTLRVALAQIAPVFLDRAATLAKVVARVEEAAAARADVVVFGEAIVPGYPVWVGRTDGARFDAADQKQLFARYAEAAVQPERGDLDAVCAAARAGGVVVVLGTIERAVDRGGHSLYCSCVVIRADGTIGAVHRKLMPTYEERLVWAPGDGAGLVVHPVGAFTLGALNCWENWLPLPRAALHAQGEDLHIAIWPGGIHNTRELTRFLALEGRSYVVSVSGVLRGADIPADVPERERIVPDDAEILLNGGSAVAGPDGAWVLEPLDAAEQLVVVELDHRCVSEARQNLDVSGHYSRPDVFRLEVDRRRQRLLHDVAPPHTMPEK